MEHSVPNITHFNVLSPNWLQDCLLVRCNVIIFASDYKIQNNIYNIYKNYER